MSPYLSQKFRVLIFFTMIGVVLVHAYNLPMRYLHAASMIEEGFSWNAYVQLFIANGLTRYGILMLFLISGYLNYPKPDRTHGETVGKRARTVLIPYLLWSLIGLLVFWGAEQDPFLWQAIQKAAIGAFSDTKVGDYSIGQLAYRLLLEPVPFQLWYLRALFTYIVLMPWFLRALRANATVFLSILGVLWFFSINLLLIEGEGCFFFCLGLWLRERNIDIQQAPRWFRWHWVALGWIGLLLLKTALAFGSYQSALPVAQVFLYHIGQILGLLTVWFGYDHLLQGRLPRPFWLDMTHYSFIIYGLHVPLLSILTDALLLTWGESEGMRQAVYWISVVSILLCCVLVGWLLRRLAPGVLGVLTGGRS